MVLELRQVLAKQVNFSSFSEIYIVDPLFKRATSLAEPLVIFNEVVSIQRLNFIAMEALELSASIQDFSENQFPQMWYKCRKIHFLPLLLIPQCRYIFDLK